MPFKPAIVPKSEPSPKQKVIKRLRKAAAESELLTCPKCASDTLTPTMTGMRYVDGKAVGGTKVMICTMCALHGERVVVA